jgi:hypothetical protein
MLGVSILKNWRTSNIKSTMPMENENIINCPECGAEINVSDALYHQLEDQIKKDYEKKSAKKEREIQKQLQEVEAEKEQVKKEKENLNELVTKEVQTKLKSEKASIEKSLRKQFQDETSEQISELQKELQEKSGQVKELNKTKAEVEKLKREKEEMREQVTLEKEKEFSDKIKNEKLKIRKQVDEENEMKFKEYEKQLADQKELTEEMKRKMEQSSMQRQGEVQELAIEEWLRANFPTDTIIEVKKGVRGGDCRHIVNSRGKENCGSIYYESKRTKDFGKGVIEKFKNDIREQGANIGIIVTEVMPQGMERMGLREGVWICSFEEFKGLCFVIREHILALDLAVASQENKGDKMVLLYDYLTSNEFKLQVEGIIEGYTQMQADLETEKRSITGHWKKREKQLKKVLNNTNFMYNSLRGIAGNAIQTIKVLELPETFDEIEADEE